MRLRYLLLALIALMILPLEPALSAEQKEDEAAAKPYQAGEKTPEDKKKAPTYNANDAKSKAYPGKEAKEPPGDAMPETFDTGWPNRKESKKALDVNGGQVTGYPKASIVTESPGNAKPVVFDSGVIHYPATEKDPADSKPMEAAEEPQDDDGRLSIPDIDLPDNVCPLLVMRDAYRSYNRALRSNVLTGVHLGYPTVTLSVRERDMQAPDFVGSGMRLIDTYYDPAEKRWVARVWLADPYLCSGTRVIWIDDSIAPGVSVLAIGQDLVLLLVENRLAYLRPRHHKPFKFRMSWDTGIDVEFEKGVSPDSRIMKAGSIKSKRRSTKRKPTPPRRTRKR